MGLKKHGTSGRSAFFAEKKNRKQAQKRAVYGSFLLQQGQLFVSDGGVRLAAFPQQNLNGFILPFGNHQKPHRAVGDKNIAVRHFSPPLPKPLTRFFADFAAIAQRVYGVFFKR